MQNLYLSELPIEDISPISSCKRLSYLLSLNNKRLKNIDKTLGKMPWLLRTDLSELTEFNMGVSDEYYD